jgi:hypothetical protein
MIAGDGTPISFVADPGIAPADQHWIYARPDDQANGGKSWRQKLVEYNQTPDTNPLGLYPAYQLYERDIYRRLVDCFGLANVYILSAGWGLIRVNFLTPYYDVTFSSSAAPHKRRKKIDQFGDFKMLPDDTEDEIVFLGGKDYLPLFCKLTANTMTVPKAFFNSIDPPSLNRCKLTHFETTTRTNWHYECANALIEGSIKI